MNKPHPWAAIAMKRSSKIAAIAVGSYLLAAVAIAVVGLNDHTADTADLIVVPGSAVAADGTPGAPLQARLDAAVKLYRAERAPEIYVSASMDQAGHDTVTIMADYLLEQDIPAAAIVRDPHGTDTAATAAHAAQYLQQQQRQRAMLATQFYHVARLRLALARHNIRVTGNLHAHYFERHDLYALLREVPAYLFYFVSQ
ncbi:ElyC/SanA/YdcF family protein [Vogesella facilis]|uniref:ElyC/SanA/YdcF family protein n=1 Tax=Vogesella facilis TaxID=1655232 RepID=A0ABV7RDV9_9NEIS